MNNIYLLDKKNFKLLLVKDYLKEFYLKKGFFIIKKLFYVFSNIYLYQTF